MQQKPQNIEPEAEQYRQNLLALPGTPLFTPTQEKAAAYAAHKKYVRQQVNLIAPFYWKMVGGVTRQEYDGLKESIRIVPNESGRTLTLKPGVLERALTMAAHGTAKDATMGVTHSDANGATRIEVYPYRIRKPYTATEVIAHEGIHYFDFNRKQYSFARNSGSEFLNQAVDEAYAQAERFIDFSDPRRSAIRQAIGRLSRTSGLETKDPLGIIRTLRCVSQGKDVLTAYKKGVGRAKYVLGRAAILELIRQGKVKKPADIYKVPPEVLKKEITRIAARSPFIYAGRFTQAVLSAPKASFEKIAEALDGQTKKRLTEIRH